MLPFLNFQILPGKWKHCYVFLPPQGCQAICCFFLPWRVLLCLLYLQHPGVLVLPNERDSKRSVYLLPTCEVPVSVWRIPAHCQDVQHCFCICPALSIEAGGAHTASATWKRECHSDHLSFHLKPTLCAPPAWPRCTERA